MSLEDKRAAIDEVDRKIVALLSERLVLSDEVGEIKRGMSRPDRDPAREREIKERVAVMATDYGLDAGFVLSIYHMIFTEAHVRRNLGKVA